VKKLWTLVAAAAALAAVVGGYFALKSRPRQAAAASPSAPVLSRFDSARLAALAITRGSSLLKLEKRDGKWKAAYPVPVVLDPAKVEDLVSTFCDLSADRVIEESPADLASFGLKPPRAVAEARLDDGTVKSFLLGDRTPTGGGSYLMVAGDPRVYAVWTTVAERLGWSMSDLRDRRLGPVFKPEEIASLIIQGRGGTVIELRQKSETERKQFQLGFGPHLMVRPYPYPVGVDSQKADALLNGAAGLEISEFVDDSPSSLARYGLDRPWGSLILRGPGGVMDLRFGADSGADKVYVKRAGAPNVYAVGKSLIGFMGTRPFDLIDRFVFIPSIDDVDRLDITAGGRTRALTITRAVKKAEKAGEEDETVSAYTVDGRTVEEDSFKKFYQALIGLSVEGETTRPASGQPEAAVRFTLNRGGVLQALVTYVPYDRDFDAVLVNGKGAFGVSKLQVSAMLSKLETLSRGEKVPD
jgi:hypothetical protein